MADVVGVVPDASVSGNVIGVAQTTLDSCTPHALSVSTDAVLGDTVRTTQLHRVVAPPAGPQIAADALVWSAVTRSLIPVLLGIPMDPTAGVMSGIARDCDGSPLSGAQIRLVDGAGAPVPGVDVRYFTTGFVDRLQKGTSADGLWLATNVPVGDVTVELWSRTGLVTIVAGATPLVSIADEVTVADVFYGYGDGIVLPGACEQ